MPFESDKPTFLNRRSTLLLGLLLPMIAGCDELQSDTGSEVIIFVEKSEKQKKEFAAYQIRPSTTRIVIPDGGPASVTPDAMENMSDPAPF